MHYIHICVIDTISIIIIISIMAMISIISIIINIICKADMAKKKDPVDKGPPRKMTEAAAGPLPLSLSLSI